MLKANWIKNLGLLLFFCFISGCPGSPAPPVEIPPILSFPATVGIDVSAISGASAPAASSALRSSVRLQVGAGGEFSNLIALGGTTFSVFNQFLDDLLLPLQSVEIPTSPPRTTFEGVINIPGILPQRVKVDLADFDLDGDGQPEGCTGCSCPLGCSESSCPLEAPVSALKRVCYRVWIQDPSSGLFERFMAGFFDVMPTRDNPETQVNEENPGKGRFRLGIENEPVEEGNQDLFFGVIYNHQDFSKPLDKITEMFVQDHRFDSAENRVEANDVHALVNQQDALGKGDPRALEKTVKLDMRSFPQTDENPGTVRYIGRFRDDFDFWSGTVLVKGLENGQPKTVSFENVCARISTGNAASSSNCEDLGIDVTGEQFINPVIPDDVILPADFPLVPIF